MKASSPADRLSTQNSADLIHDLLSGERTALARAITAVENETPEALSILRAIQDRLGRGLVVGFTGAPGAGKSTLVSAYITQLRQAEYSVGVVAIDPSSPISGGAILGDRIRMTGHTSDAGVFVRSLAARGHLGGLSRTAARVVDVMDAAGRDIIIVETVGTGQSEVDIAELANVNIVLCAPGLGDDIQAIKAGILEIADILVVNKADQPLAERSFRQLSRMAELRESGTIPVLKTIATQGDGVAQLMVAVQAIATKRNPQHDRLNRSRRLLAQLTADDVRKAIMQNKDLAMDNIAQQLSMGAISLNDAVHRAISLLALAQSSETKENDH